MSNSRSGGIRTYLERIDRLLDELKPENSEEYGAEVVLREDVEKVRDEIREMLKDVV